MTLSVEFRKSGRIVTWAASESLLTFAEEHGLDAPSSCGAGVCGTCATTLLAGEVSYVEDPLYMPDPGVVLLCCTIPKTSVILDL